MMAQATACRSQRHNQQKRPLETLPPLSRLEDIDPQASKPQVYLLPSVRPCILKTARCPICDNKAKVECQDAIMYGVHLSLPGKAVLQKGKYHRFVALPLDRERIRVAVLGARSFVD